MLFRSVYTTNLLLDMLEADTYDDPGKVKKIETPSDLEETLKGILDYALEKKIIEQDSVVLRDLFDTKIMNGLMPRPGEVIRAFWEKYEKSPKEATGLQGTKNGWFPRNTGISILPLIFPSRRRIPK